MTIKSNQKKQSDWSIFLILLVITALVYLPGINRLGYYRDDWNNLFNAYTQGSQMLIMHYASDRPLDGYLLRYAFDILGYNPLPYLIINLIFRFLSGFFFYRSILVVWRNLKFPAFVATALFLVYPGFLRQVDGIAYLPHQFAMTCMIVSIWLSLVALRGKAMGTKVAAAVPSVALAILGMFLMEYYLSLEVFRAGLFYCYFYNSTAEGKSKVTTKALKAFLPWALGIVIFIVWRGLVFEASRAGTNLKPIIQEFLDHPRFTGAIWLQKLLLNWFKAMFGSWVIPTHMNLNNLTVKMFWGSAAWALIPAAVFLIGFILLMPERRGTSSAAEESAAERMKANWRHQWLVLGSLSTLLILLPLIIAGREINFSSSLDRFGYPSAYSAILFLVGLMASIEGKWLKIFIFTGIIWAASTVQTINKHNYIAQTETVNDFWWQLAWRAPGIKPGTLVIPSINGFPAEEDYELFVPIHLIYYPDEDHVVIGSELINQIAVKNAKMGIVDDRKVREIFLQKDYGKLLALSKPGDKSCLHVIDGRIPVYSSVEWSRIQVVGSYSQIDLIETEGEPATVPEAFFGPEPEHGWCYYYQTMSIAQQNEDWEAAARLADEALAAGLHAEDAVEWIPLVQSYAYTGRFEEAKPYGEILKTDKFLQFETCQYFRSAAEFLTKPMPDPRAQEFLEKEFCE